MSNPMDTEPPTGNASSSSTPAPKKPSIRVLDQNPETLVTREEDLANGPSLLGFGVGVGGHEYATFHRASHLGLDPEFEGLGHHHNHPETSMLPSIPSGLPTALSLQASELSDAGASFSLPADSLLSEHVSRPEAHMRQSTSDNRAAGLFVWEYEFSWENSCLCFAGEPLNVVRATEDQYSKVDPDSKTTSLASGDRTQSAEGDGALLADGDEFAHLAGIGSFDDTVKSWVASEFPRDLEIALKTCVVSDAGSSSDAISEGDLDTSASDPQRILGYLQNIDSLVELLAEDFLRSYAPQRSRKRNTAARKQAAHDTARDLGTVTETTSTPIRRKTGPRKRKAIGGSGGSDDEESRDDGQGTSRAGELRGSRSFACPFLKWKEHRYRDMCTLRLTTVSHVKDHLRKRHTDTYCPTCHKRFGWDEVGPHSPCLPKPAPITLITTDKLKEINKDARGMKIPPKEQWYRLYQVLFPNEPPCFSPYLDNVQEERLRDAENYLRSKKTLITFRKMAQDMDFGGESLAKIFEFVYYQFLPHVWVNYAPNGEVQCSDDESVEPAYDNDRAIEHLRSSETLNPNLFSMNSEHASSYGLRQPPNPATTAQAYSAPVLSGPSTLMPGVFETHPSIEGIANEEPPDTPETGDLEPSGPGAFGPMVDGDFSRLLGSEGHQTHEPELERAWNLSFGF